MGLGAYSTAFDARPTGLSGLSGLSGLGELLGAISGLSASELPDNYKTAAREAIRFWARSIDRAAAALDERDLDGAKDILANVEKSYDLGDVGWEEGRASKSDALSVLRSALSEVERGAPGWFGNWIGEPPKQVAAFVSAARSIAARFRGRADSKDFDKPALTEKELLARGADPLAYQGGVIAGGDAGVIEASDAEWARKVAEDQARALAQICNPVAVFTGEISAADYFQKCVEIPWWAKLAGAGAVGLAGWKAYRWLVR